MSFTEEKLAEAKLSLEKNDSKNALKIINHLLRRIKFLKRPFKPKINIEYDLGAIDKK